MAKSDLEEILDFECEGQDLYFIRFRKKVVCSSIDKCKLVFVTLRFVFLNSVHLTISFFS